MELPNRVTEEKVKSIIKTTMVLLGLDLELRHNAYQRLAVFVVNGPMLTPGYLSKRELYCWLHGVWLREDRKDLIHD